MRRALLLLMLVGIIAMPMWAGGMMAYHLELTEIEGYNPPALPGGLTGPLNIGVLDEREEIVSEEYRPTLVGIGRASFGVPYPVTTASGKPLAQELAEAIARALEKQGAAPRVVGLRPGLSRTEAVAALGEAKGLLLEIREWESDTSRSQRSQSFRYDVTLSTFNSQGKQSSSTSLSSEDEVGPKERPSRRDIQTAAKDVLRVLLGNADTLAGLASANEPAGQARCTTEQILKLKEAGMSDEQIKAACPSKLDT